MDKNTKEQKFPSFEPTPDCYVVFTDKKTNDENPKIIGAANMILGDDFIFILNFEVVEKRQGHGRKIITELLEKNSIQGVVTPSSKQFWEDLGAEITSDNRFSLSKDQLQEDPDVALFFHFNKEGLLPYKILINKEVVDSIGLDSEEFLDFSYLAPYIGKRITLIYFDGDNCDPVFLTKSKIKSILVKEDYSGIYFEDIPEVKQIPKAP